MTHLEDRTAERVRESWIYRAFVAVVWGIASHIINRRNRA